MQSLFNGLIRHRMRPLLLSFSILALFWPLCDAQCSRTPVSENGCIKRGKLHHVHTVWRTNNCERCECKPEAMVCCSRVLTPTKYNREKCIPMFHKPTCSIRVVKKNNPSAFCRVFSAVG
ncbi:beta-microseminoprotein [Heteronotia binoei]|uniref:beta-microseminoprotein n=1 Tax=Heteronotia binoei TaxID=13085 RepID=UPI002930F88D|nr:beta-microseminoprotein [Heteronotia binoei]